MVNACTRPLPQDRSPSIFTRATTVHNNDKHWNHAHLLALALLTPYALAAQAAGWDAFTTLAVHLVATLAWFALFERWRPFRAAWQPAAADLRRDGAFLGVNAVADGLVGLLVAAIALRWAGSGPASAWPAWPNSLHTGCIAACMPAAGGGGCMLCTTAPRR
jgi:hypothetical protein